MATATQTETLLKSESKTEAAEVMDFLDKLSVSCRASGLPKSLTVEISRKPSRWFNRIHEKPYNGQS